MPREYATSCGRRHRHRHRHIFELQKQGSAIGFSQLNDEIRKIEGYLQSTPSKRSYCATAPCCVVVRVAFIQILHEAFVLGKNARAYFHSYFWVEQPRADNSAMDNWQQRKRSSTTFGGVGGDGGNGTYNLATGAKP